MSVIVHCKRLFYLFRLAVKYSFIVSELFWSIFSFLFSRFLFLLTGGSRAFVVFNSPHFNYFVSSVLIGAAVAVLTDVATLSAATSVRRMLTLVSRIIVSLLIVVVVAGTCLLHFPIG